MTRRREREVDRELLRLAKLKHAESFGDDAPIDRVKIRRFKKELRKKLSHRGSVPAMWKANGQWDAFQGQRYHCDPGDSVPTSHTHIPSGFRNFEEGWRAKRS